MMLVSGPLKSARKARANEQGLTSDQVARRILAQVLTPGVEGEGGSMTSPGMAGEATARAFVQWAESHRETPPLSDEAISRASLYPDRW